MGVVSGTEKYYHQTVIQKTALYKIKTIKNGTIRHIIVFFIRSRQSLIDVCEIVRKEKKRNNQQFLERTAKTILPLFVTSCQVICLGKHRNVKFIA